MIACAEFVDGLDDTCAVGHRHAPILGRHAPGGDAITVEVPRRGVETDADLAGSKLAGVFSIDKPQAVQTAGALLA